jgi:hypothetical protein
MSTKAKQGFGKGVHRPALGNCSLDPDCVFHCFSYKKKKKKKVQFSACHMDWNWEIQKQWVN